MAKKTESLQPVKKAEQTLIKGAETNPSPDHETRLTEQDHHSLKLWLRLLTCSSLIESSIRESLREEFNTTLPRFDFMAQLQRVPEGLTMGELSKRMMVSGGNVSGIATQLVKDGLVIREPLTTDRRTFVVKLSTKGLSLFNRMATRHEEWVIGLIGTMGAEKIDQLMSLLGQLKTTTLAMHSAQAGNKAQAVKLAQAN